MSTKSMVWKPFLLLHSAALFLFSSWLWPVSSPIWDSIDKATFHYLNAMLEGNYLLQFFWAIANVRAIDLLGAIVMALFLFLYIADSKTGEEKRLRIQKMIFLCIWGELGILFTKEVLDAIIQKYQLLRNSPTVIISNAVMISEMAPWLKVKDFSHSCFPGDHAEIVIQWLSFIYALCGPRYFLLALPCGIFFILPRLIGGAHWLSDALAGSLPIALVVLAWGLYSPLYYYTWSMAAWLTQKLSLFIRKQQ